MKILFTGITSAQLRPAKQMVEKINVPWEIVDELRAQGHEVDWRAPEFGEDLTRYDLVWVCLAGIMSMNGVFGLPAVWAAGKAFATGQPLVLFFDDWQYTLTLNQLKSIAVHRDRYIMKRLGNGNLLFRDAERMTEEQKAVVQYFCDESLHPALWDHATVVVPRFTGVGDDTQVRTRIPGEPPLFKLDPSRTALRFVQRAETTPPADKLRHWALASLVPHANWVEKQGLTWPVDYFGSRKLQAPRLASEADVATETGRRWGTLAPRYTTLKGVGWFRSRFVYAAAMGSIMYCGKEDAAALGEPYLAATDPAFVERSDQRFLESVAAQQHEAFWPKLDHDGSIFSRDVARIVEAAT